MTFKATDIVFVIAAAKNAGHGAPELEYRFAPPRRWRFDLCWPAKKVAFEREGSTWQGGRHTSGKGFRNDAEKYNEAAIRGWLVIRATVDMIRSGLATDHLLAALAARTALTGT